MKLQLQNTFLVFSVLLLLSYCGKKTNTEEQSEKDSLYISENPDSSLNVGCDSVLEVDIPKKIENTVIHPKARKIKPYSGKKTAIIARWKVNSFSFVNETEYKLFHPNSEISAYGYYLEFKKDDTYLVYDTYPICGLSVISGNNEISGKYKWINNNYIRLSGSVINKPDKDLGLYYVHILSGDSLCIKLFLSDGNLKYDKLRASLSDSIENSQNKELIKTTLLYSEETPVFPDGEDAMMKFITDNLIYPDIAKKNGIEGRVIVRFVVTKTGEINNIEVLRSPNFHMEKEAIRIIKSMPKWKPGKNNGEPVNVYFTLPVVFKLDKK